MSSQATPIVVGDAERRHVLVLGDQLSSTAGILAEADSARTQVLLIESSAWMRRRRYHRQKLVLVVSAMRHLGAELRERGFTVHEYRVDAFEDGLRAHLERFPGAVIEVMEPAEHGLLASLASTVTDAGGRLEARSNALWLSSDDAFDAWAEGRRSYRMEHWYRHERRRTGWLMDADGTPAGGRWNYDRDNRRPVPSDQAFAEAPWFEPDVVTLEVMAWVDEAFPDLPGATAGFGWPVTRAAALEALDRFVEERLRDFGPYQDAMLDDDSSLAHSLLSTAMNLGLVTAREACDAALAAFADPSRSADPERAIPIASVEGFIRQLLGWREFLRHMYRRTMPALAQANALGHARELPPFYWTGDTAMRCVAAAVGSVLANGHAHHIQRLMVLGNWALLAGVEPRLVNDWFSELFVDAYDWVVTPNVMGMSQWAEQSFTSKPYVSGGAYIARMSDHCRHCRFDPRRSIGEDACPFTSLYWDFVDRHDARLVAHPRMANAVRSWHRRDPHERVRILDRAEEVRRAAANASL